MSPRVTAATLGAVAIFLLPTVTAAQSAEIVYADGRREPVAEPRQDSKGGWTAAREGRRLVLRPGEVVVVVDGAGKETVLIPELVTTPDPPETAALLASLRDPKNTTWLQAAEQLAARPSKGVLDALVALASDRRKELRSRAIGALARLRTRESVTAATTAILAEKDSGLRREAASVLFSVQEIFTRCDAAKSVAAGLADKDPVVRVVFAALAPPGLEAALAVLRADGLKSGDHHIRESAAVELGRQGDGAGESILVGMLARTRLPGFDGGDELMERYLVREQVEVCGILGKLGTERGKAALQKATSSRLEPVRKAAEAALASGAPGK